MTENNLPSFFTGQAIGSDPACGPCRGHLAMTWRLHQLERRRARRAPSLNV